MRKGKKSPDEMTFLEHLEDLRKRLFYSFISLFISSLEIILLKYTVREIL